MTNQKTGRAGFTIVELLIVIVVIAILAAITVVAYNGIQGRANDSRRLEDIKSIAKALELYKVNTGSYPNVVSTQDGLGNYISSGWETSTNGTTATDFLAALRTSGVASSVPLDPKNGGNATNTTPSRFSTSYEYFYYKYAAGTSGCNIARGDFYVLGITRMEIRLLPARVIHRVLDSRVAAAIG